VRLGARLAERIKVLARRVIQVGLVVESII
jgi:hypothetical protein